LHRAAEKSAALCIFGLLFVSAFDFFPQWHAMPRRFSFFRFAVLAGARHQSLLSPAVDDNLPSSAFSVIQP
jgi:hypothetical protein